LCKAIGSRELFTIVKGYLLMYDYSDKQGAWITERSQTIMNITKEEAKKLIDKLPDQATWDDIMYEFYVKKKLTVALKAAQEGRVVSHEKAKKRLLAK
jgi:hypothetical protein